MRVGHSKWCGKSGEIGFDFIVQEVEGKGLGLFELRDISRCEKILTERPVVSVVEIAVVNPEIQLRKEPLSVRQAFFKLAPGTGTLQTTFDTNLVRINPAGGDSGIFINFSRANHSCLGNCEHEFLEDHGAMIMIASRDIKAGDEICFSYLDGAKAKDRKQKLIDNWGFECKCKACLDDSLSAKMELIDLLDARLFEEIKKGETAKCLKIGEQLMKLYDQLDASERFYCRTYFDLYQAAIQKKEFYNLAVQFIEKAYETSLAYYGYQHEAVRNNKALLANPSSHPNCRR